MSREIKFRAFLNKLKRIYPVVSIGLDRTWITVNQNGLYRTYKFEQASLMQYTGLKDKNGVEIYEGDVAIWYVNSTQVAGEVYYDGQQSFDMRNNRMGYIGWDANRGEIEVIGNIYENPELLEATNE